MTHHLFPRAVFGMLLFWGVLIPASGPYAGPKTTTESPCPHQEMVCIPVVFYLKKTQESSIRRFLARHLRIANRLFKPLNVGFFIRRTQPLKQTHLELVTRSDRDKLASYKPRRGVANVFIVDRLQNVDEPGEIRGVHWRYRKHPKTRYVILARKAMSWVLAHEWGHFFGLPHSKDDRSIMNKRPRKRPVKKRRFTPSEIKHMQTRLKKMLRTGFLLNASKKRAGKGLH
jgi:hypothetical protein